MDRIGHRHVLVSGQALQLIHQIVRKRNALHHPLIITKTCAVVTNLNLAFPGIPQMRRVVGLSPRLPERRVLARGRKGPFRDGVGLIGRLLGFGLGKRGAEHSGLVLFEALNFGLHVF